MRDATHHQATEYLIELEDDARGAYTGRIVGAMIADHEEVQVYGTDDGRVIVYDAAKLEHWEVDFDSVVPLNEQIPAGVYLETMKALGQPPLVDL
jgi:hypothetical protein